eukprot:1157385-Pelagomonas_calceolata.AAC.8
MLLRPKQQQVETPKPPGDALRGSTDQTVWQHVEKNSNTGCCCLDKQHNIMLESWSMDADSQLSQAMCENEELMPRCKPRMLSG